MWQSVAHAAAPHRSKPGEERRHLPGHQEHLTHHQGSSSTGHRSIGALPGRFPHLASKVDHCGPLARRAVCCALAIPAAPCVLPAPRADFCARLGIPAARCPACRAAGRIPMLPHQGGMTHRCPLAGVAIPACPCLRALAHSRPRMSVCHPTIHAARRARKADRRRARPHFHQRQEDGMMPPA
jgi:hypothetical protein